MTTSFRTRLLAGYAGVVVVALAIAGALVLRREHEWLVGRHFDELERVARLAAPAAARATGAADGFADSLGSAAGLRVTLIGARGDVLGDSEVAARDLARVANHADRAEVAAALAGSTGRAVRRSDTIGRDLVYVAVPVPRSGIAVLRLAEPLADVRRLDAAVLNLLLGAGALSLLASLPLLLWASRRFSARLESLEQVTRRLGAGDPTARAVEQPADELGRLARALNRMAAEGRQRLETIERERDERERILAHLADGVALVDAEGRVVRMNGAFARLLGSARPAEPGTPLQSYARWPELEELMQSARHGGRAVEGELRLWTPAQRLLRVSAAPLGGANEGLVLLVARDLTEIEALSRVRQDFVANVSHELRTPLTSLRGYAETLLDGGLDDAEHREGFVRVIRDQAARLEALVEDLLSLAALERPDARLVPERFDLRESAARLAASFEPQAGRAGLALVVEPGPPVEVLADRVQIEQALANLVDNAIKYTERGTVTVRLGADRGRSWFEVEDTGPGIPEADQPRIFERFYRVDKARSREKGGTGLGLAIVKHVAALHGGQVSVSSRLGQGSRFRFEIPREDHGHHAPSA